MRIFGLFFITPFAATQVLPPVILRTLVYVPPGPVIAFLPQPRLRGFGNGLSAYPIRPPPLDTNMPPSFSSTPQLPQLIVQQTPSVLPSNEVDNTVAGEEATASIIQLQTSSSSPQVRQPARLDEELRVSEVLERLPSAQQFVELGIEISGEDAPVKRSMYLNFYASCLIQQGEPTDRCFESTDTSQCISHHTHDVGDSSPAHNHSTPPGFLWGCFIQHARCPEFNASIWATDCKGATGRFLQCLTGSTPQPDEINLIEMVCSTA
eukprot:Protomagalhaensia_sp_Gyna_25__4380@NODE_3_length_9524_cov_26_759410_g2_i0_p5_GENE_NODE_3_length_9524_cov_26_759410_g2_i0NODE_3_length_9524_cov_26_759410_g2_i0_p5_ORF_typecomplete_len265_score23_88_NODE_3_length_9524_cov_26_759410_g2_i048965690